MASPRGFEPPTSGLGNRCSIRLSYGDVAADIAFDVRGVCPFWAAAGAGTRANSLPAFPAVSALRFTARNPSDAVSKRLFRLDCGRLNVTRSSRNLSRIASRIVSANLTSRAGVRRRRICFFGSRWSSSAWSGPCQGVALSEEPLGHAGGSPGGTDAFNPVAPSVAEGPSLYRRRFVAEKRSLDYARDDGCCQSSSYSSFSSQ